MGADISIEAVAGKLNRVGYESFLQGLRQAKSAGNRNLELAHWLMHILQKDRTDLALTADHFKLDRARLLADATAVVNGFRKNETEMPGISNPVADALDRGWHYATLLFGETQIRTGHLLVGILKSLELRRALIGVSQEFAKLPVDEIAAGQGAIWVGSDEGNLRPMDGSGVAAAGTEGAAAAPGAKGTTALDRFSQDLTARAKAGQMDPVLGREDEVRQVIDVLMRRRQNNPILTGEAGVGKTAIVEGFAQRIASGDVPPPLQGVKLCVLDVGLMQAGASMKGEFEQRLRSVIDEVQSSPTPIILFIDEAHTLIDDLTEAVLELPPHSGARLEQPQIERPQRNVFQRGGHVAARDPVRQSLDDGRLADARLAREDGVVLPPAHQDVDHLADLVLASHDRVELLFACALRQIDGELRERLLLAHRGGRDRLGALGRGDRGGRLLLGRSREDRRKLLGQIVRVDLQELARDGREDVTEVRRLDHPDDGVPDAHSRLPVLQARIEPAPLDGLFDVDRQVAYGGRPARQAVERLEQVACDAPRVELEVPRDPVQVRVGLLEYLVKPVRQLHVRVAPHLAKDGGAFEGAVAKLVELSEERGAADVGHGEGDSSQRG